MRLRQALLLVHMALLLGWAWAQPPWHQLRLNPFQVAFPQKPQLKVTQEDSMVGPVRSDNYEFQGEDYHLVFSLTRLPSLAVTFRGAEGLYEDASGALLKQHRDSKVLRYGPLEFSGRRGAELQFSVGEREQGRARFILLGEQLMVAQAVWRKTASEREALRFLESVSIAR